MLIRLPLILIVGLLATILSILLWIFWDLPPVDALEAGLASPSIRITDRFDRILYEVLDPAGGRHSPISLESIPEALKLATIATEDQNFYTNPGVDLLGIIRAMWINLRGGETLAGGSTITQQVARNLLLSEEEQFERTLRRKLRESWLAWRLSRKYDKDQVLGFYLNQIYYGGLSYGVEAASRTYFGKSASMLDLAESALIAGIPQGPALYNPLVDPKAAQYRQHIVLELMRNQGYITQDEFENAFRQQLNYTPTPYPIEAPHFVMMVNAEVDQLLPPAGRPPNQTIIIHTTLDLDLQHLAERAVDRHLEALSNPNSTTSVGTSSISSVPGGHNVNNAAMVALDPVSGELLAMVGSPDYFNPDFSGAINMTIMPRQPGSALKPLLYASAFDPAREDPITAVSMILDVRTSFDTGGESAYTPANFDNQEHGPVSARTALASSLNIPAVVTLDRIGIPDLVDIGLRMGISTFGDPQSYDLSLALGGGEVTLLELSTAYGVFATLGFNADPVSILDITTLNGDLLYQHQPEPPTQVIDERVAWLISDILNDNQARTLGFGENSTLKIDRSAAVKTGTTTNFHDNWTIGYTPDLVVGVWVGNASHEPMRSVTGLSGAGPIWHQFIREALSGTPENWFNQPEGMTRVEVCALSGYLPSDACSFTKYEWFIDGTEPTIQDTVYHRVWVNTLTGNLATESTPPGQRVQKIALDLPPGAHPWARSEGLLLLSDLERQIGASHEGWDEFPLQIVTPGNYSSYQFDPDLEPESQRIHIDAVSGIELEQVSIFLDGENLGTFTGPPYEVWWALEVGDFSLWVEGITPEGEVIESPRVVISVIRGE